jgi:hypothetical protein
MQPPLNSSPSQRGSQKKNYLILFKKEGGVEGERKVDGEKILNIHLQYYSPSPSLHDTVLYTFSQFQIHKYNSLILLLTYSSLPLHTAKYFPTPESLPPSLCVSLCVCRCTTFPSLPLAFKFFLIPHSRRQSSRFQLSLFPFPFLAALPHLAEVTALSCPP